HNYTESVCDTGITAPAYFTAGGTGTLKFGFTTEPATFSVRIFDSKKNEVFRFNSLDTAWNGTNKNGEPLEAGVYDWIISYSYKPGELEKSCIGTVRLYLQEQEKPCDTVIFIPHTFFTCGDGINDRFIVAFGCPPAEFELWIFNRWGELVHESTEPNEGWDATFKGMQAKEDVYVYKVKYNYKKGDDKKELVGHVTLLR
ncbi:MAG TPA: gliding motility-associated C-terminal domain-containing protein, partial [Flavobacteriales bacterium]|nr:gliding motility-associated C-terminal domain-containing protein [Flavobacteriales bacterium]